MVMCLERGADLHMAQLMPLPLTVSCSSKIQIGFTFLVPAHPRSPGQRAVKRNVCMYLLIREFGIFASLIRVKLPPSCDTRLRRRRRKSRLRRSTPSRPVYESSCWTSKEAYETSRNPALSSSRDTIGNEQIILNDTVNFFFSNCNQHFGNFEPPLFPSAV